jgi:tRNA dimethylallyltransferase
LNKEREELFSQINLRVDQMFEQGLVEEAQQLYPFRNLNSLNTVGYKEIFQHFDGSISLEEARELIKRNTRNYAKRQLTWFKRYKDIEWFSPLQIDEIKQFLKAKLDE